MIDYTYNIKKFEKAKKAVGTLDDSERERLIAYYIEHLTQSLHNANIRLKSYEDCIVQVKKTFQL